MQFYFGFIFGDCEQYNNQNYKVKIKDNSRNWNSWKIEGQRKEHLFIGCVLFNKMWHISLLCRIQNSLHNFLLFLLKNFFLYAILLRNAAIVLGKNTIHDKKCKTPMWVVIYSSFLLMLFSFSNFSWIYYF